MPSDLDVAYLAGLIDGEGCLAIRNRVRWKSISVEVVGTDRVPLDWAQATFGGVVGKLHEKRPNRRQPWHWRITATEPAAELARIVRPYLKVKQAEATLLVVLGLLRSGRRSVTSPVLHPEAESHLARLSTLLKQPEKGGWAAYEEVLDLAVYLRQRLEEDKINRRELS